MYWSIASLSPYDMLRLAVTTKSARACARSMSPTLNWLYFAWFTSSDESLSVRAEYVIEVECSVYVAADGSEIVTMWTVSPIWAMSPS